MEPWLKAVRQIEALDGLPLDGDLVERLREQAGATRPTRIRFHVPSFKRYASTEIAACGKSPWPAVSITGPDCALQCDHCKAKVLEPMIPARTPDALWRVANEQIEQGAQGMLLTGGSNRRNEVEYHAFYPVVRRIKDAFPEFRIALHTALTDADGARCMEQAGIDAAMMDVIGAQDTITQVYHLRRSVDDFERTLETLVATRLKVVPHIVLGLHYGRLLGEWQALEIVARHRPDALVLVAAMPFYAPASRPFITPDPHAVGRFFLDARRALPGLPLLLGCARPPGRARLQIDAYAVMAGFSGVAHPADGMVELALRLGREVRVTPSCCSVAAGEEAMALAADRSQEVEGADFLARNDPRGAMVPIHWATSRA
jgi:uncharacterized radical SAM superfamily protein